MPFKVDFADDGTAVPWEATGDDENGGATATADPDYRPAILAAARNDRTRYLEWLGDALAADPKVAELEWMTRYRDLQVDEPSPMVRVGLDRIDEVRQVAREIRAREQDAHAPGVLALYDVDLDPQFRYCLDTDCPPDSGRPLRRLSLSLPGPALADGDLTELQVEHEPAGDSERAICERVERTLAERDPDVLVLSSADLVPLLASAGVDLGRRPGYRKLAGESTFTSYGQVGHSPARYDVPGRAIVDRSNSFLLSKSGMAGLAYFVTEAGKPLQEVARDSIGGVLTAIEIRKARERGVPAPWQKRQTEQWKDVDLLHAADRGGFTFQPELGVHEAVHELDFASLYPNVIREYDVSPDTVRCACHDTDDVPELGYSLCERDGFLGDVLDPLLNHRAGWKARLQAAEDPASDVTLDADERARLDDEVEAVKWVLVSCFGYQGYRHAKFGRIEVHEAINAVARDVMLQAKEAFEDAGWRIVNGIVDSLWVTADPERDQRPVTEVAAEVTDQVGIALEHEGRFDWIAFCPRKRASGAALMRYFGKWHEDSVRVDADEADRFKFRGVEARQRSTCAFVAEAQRGLVETFDEQREPAAVCERLRGYLRTLRRGTVAPGELAVRQRVSKRAEAYEQATRAKAALERAAEVGVPRSPGQSVDYVVVDDARSGPERVRLAFEFGDCEDDASASRKGYDADFYADRLIRACESVLSPLGWDETRVRRYLRDERDATLSSFVE